MISDKDADIINLVKALTLLDSQIAKLSVDIDNEYVFFWTLLLSKLSLTKACNSPISKERIRSFLENGQRMQAMTVLKQRKSKEAHYEKRTAMRDNVMQIMLETQNCSTHQQVCSIVVSSHMRARCESVFHYL